MIELKLALQGGGAHGAFTWGVLDRLLEEAELRITSISGTSAGAMNAVMCASGYLESGAEGARQRLDAFWNGIALSDPLGAAAGLWVNPFVERGYSSVTATFSGMSRWISPYDMPASDHNPLQLQIEALVDFARLNADSGILLSIAATAVRSGQLRLFRNGELSSAALLASACLPSIHKGIEIDGELYWDGGWSGNPVIYPLIEAGSGEDILVVLLQPLLQESFPRRAADIARRSAELGFSASFMREMQALAQQRERLAEKWLVRDAHDRRYLQARFHLLHDSDYLESLEPRSRLDIRRSFLLRLKQRGRDSASQWLQQHRADLGVRSSFSLQDAFG